jgi:hypothetical protein
VTEHDDPDLTLPTAGTATEEELGTLHGTIARTLTDVCAGGAVVLDAEGEPVRVTAPAAYIGAAIAFLKNNNITASPTKNKDLAALKDTLAKKRQRKELTGRTLKEAGDEFERMQGSNGLMQ